MRNGTIALLASAAMMAGAVQAKEGGDQYPNGAENWFAGALPPPGNYLLNYFGHVSGTLRDGHGGKVIAPNGKGVSLNATFEAPRFVKVTDTTLFGANYGWAVFLPPAMDLSINAAGARDGRIGFGDANITPIVLAWHSPEWHYALGLDVYLPTGAYDKNNAPGNNLGANYYSFEPVFALTYLGKNGWEVSGKFMYNMKTRNKDTDYQSGDEFHMDYLVGKHMGPWSVGVSGYYLRQTGDDEQGGVKVGTDGNRGRVFAIGPSVKYETAAHAHLIFQWQKEFSAENRFQGDMLWFKLIMPIR